jgi:Raf kinase inhibitor-like YbhB/YbcL family protein
MDVEEGRSMSQVTRWIAAGGAVAAILGLGAAGCRRQPPAAEVTPAPPPREVSTVGERFAVTSPAFAEGARISARYTADGADVSPPLSWSGAPEGTVAFALIMDDPDAPRGTWTHWVLYDLPAARTALPEGVATRETPSDLGGAKQGLNDFRKVGYGGPAPPPGPAHHYRFTLYALDAPLDLPPRARAADVERAMQPHLLGQARLVGTYSR